MRSVRLRLDLEPGFRVAEAAENVNSLFCQDLLRRALIEDAAVADADDLGVKAEGLVNLVGDGEHSDSGLGETGAEVMEEPVPQAEFEA